MWDLSSPSSDQTQFPCIAGWILKHWTTREVPTVHQYIKFKSRCLHSRQDVGPSRSHVRRIKSSMTKQMSNYSWEDLWTSHEEAPVYVCVCVCVCNLHNKLCHTCMLSHVQFYAIPWTGPASLLCPWDFQARTLEWVAMPFSRGSSQPSDRTQVSCIAGRLFTVWATRGPNKLVIITKKLQTHRYREQTSGHQWRCGSIGVGEGEVQTVGCKINYRAVLYNMGNIVSIF